ncbi:MAG: PAS domain S-box protein [Cytophagales bacterium]|nr:PAS domain S-box protein [Bernardetiaceae bacterium]MDW8205187.1 PAS domain S-box protein [Cytophagales bacterium]
MFFLKIGKSKDTQPEVKQLQPAADKAPLRGQLSEHTWICLHDLAGNIIRLNDAMASCFEAFNKAGKPENMRHFIAYDSQHLFEEYLAQIANKPYAAGIQKLIDKEGNLRYVQFEARVEPPSEQYTNAYYVRWSAKDISDEQPETSQQEYYQQLFEDSPQPMVLLNAGCYIIQINKAALQLLRKPSAKSVIKNSFYELIGADSDTQKKLHARITEAWQNRQATYHLTGANLADQFQQIEILFKKTAYGKQEVLIAYLTVVNRWLEPVSVALAEPLAPKIVDQIIQAVAAMHQTEAVLTTAITQLHKLNYVKGAGFYQVNENAYSATLQYFFNIDHFFLTAFKELSTTQYPAIFQEQQLFALPTEKLGHTQINHFLFVPLVIECKVSYVLLFELADSANQSWLLFYLLGIAISHLIAQLQLKKKWLQSESCLHAIADSSPMLLRITNAAGECVFFNQQWCKLIQAYQQPVTAWWQAIHPDDKLQISNVFDEHFAKQQSLVVSYRIFRPNGECQQIQEKGIPYFNSQNNFQGFIFSATDVAAHTTRENHTFQAATFHYSREALESTLNDAPQLALTIEPDGRISYCNRSLLTATGWQKQDLIGMPLQQIFAFESATEQATNTLLHKQLLSAFQGKFRCANDQHLHVQFHTVVWNYPDQNRTAVTIVGEPLPDNLHVQQTLEPSSQLLQDLFDNASDLIQITDATGQFIFVNKAWYNILEYRPEDVRSMRLQDIIHPDFALAWQHTLRKATTEGAISNFETCFVSRSGRKINLRGSLSYNFKAGKLGIYRAILHDVTEQIRLEKAQTLYYNLSKLTVSSNNLEALYHNFYIELKKNIEIDSFLIALRNEKDQSIYFPYYVNSDYAPDEGIQGRSFAEYALNFDRPMFFYGDMLQRIMQTNNIPIDSPLPQTWIGVPLKIDQKVIGILVLQSYKDRRMYNKRDLDLLNFISGQLATAIQRTQNQEKINEQNARLQAIFESGQHLMWSVNKDLVITRFNGNYANSLRQLYNIHLTAGMSLLDIYRQNDREQVYFWLDKYKLALAGYPQQFERKMVGINGEEYWYEVFLNPIVTTNSFEVDEVAGVAHNITVKKRAADELRLAKELAEHSLEVKKRFLSNMSHEIRTPMNGIIGMIDLLSEAENLEPEYRQYITTIKKSSETLLHILNDILDLSKIEAGKMELRKVPISLKNMMDKLIALFQQRALQKDIGFSYHIAPDVPPFVLADETRLLQILSNLTSNALKFTEKGSIEIVLEVAQTPNPDDVVLNETQQGYLLKAKVIDTGIGIAPEQQELLFQKFSQLDNSYTKSHGGTGLGLAISQELCKLMHGDIGVLSQLGVGSTFWFTFRAQACSAEEVMSKQTENSHESPISGQIPFQPNILVVDDNRVNLNVARSILKRAGCNVSIARSGAEAIEMVQQQPFDLIFMDVQMPVMNGIETTQRIKQLCLPHLPPIVAMTAFSMQEERASFLQAGMDDFIAKPIKAQALVAKVKELLTNSQPSPPVSSLEETQPPAQANLAIINPEVVAQMTKYGGREMIAEAYTDFDQESRRLLEALAIHISEKQFDQAKNILHTLKGNAGTLGIEKLYMATANFEAAIKQNQVHNAEEAFANVIRFFTEFQQHYRTILQIS